MPNARRRLNARRAAADAARSRCTDSFPRPRRWTEPAAWKSPESSASRSQSRSGAIPASSSRSSSASIAVALEREQPPLVLEPERAVRAEAGRADDPVARDEEPEPVASAEAAGRARCARRSGKHGELAVADDLSRRDGAQRAGAPAVELRLVLEVDRNRVERRRVAVEVAADRGDHRRREAVSRRSVRGGARLRELVPDDAFPVEPQLPRPPPVDLVGDPPRHAPTVAPLRETGAATIYTRRHEQPRHLP